MIIDLFFLGPKMRMYYYMFVLIILVFLILINRKTIITEYTKISKKIWVILLTLTFFGFIMRFAFSPMQTITQVSVWTHRYFAVYISEKHMIPPEIHTRGYSFLISPLYSFTGDIIFSAHFFDIVIGSLSIIMIFMLTYLLFRDQNAALISALILTVLPWHVFFSGTHGVELTASFFMMLSMIVFLIALESKEPGIYFLAFISLLFTALVRKEQMILLLVFFIYFIIKKNPIRMEKKTQILVSLLGAAILFIPFSIDALHKKIRADLFDYAYLNQNIISILEIFGYNFYITLLILAPIALYILDRKIVIENREPILFLILWFLIIILPFIIHREIHTRYFIFFLLPFIILESFSISSLFKTKQKRSIIIIMMTGLILSAAYIYSDCTQNSDSEYISAKSLDESVPKLPQIHSILNNTDEEDMLVVFIDDDERIAYITLYGEHHPYIVLEIRSVCDFNARLTNSQESAIENVENKVVNRYTGYNIYLLVLQDDFEDYCNSRCLQCIDTFKYRKSELYYSGSGYKIYHYDKSTSYENS